MDRKPSPYHALAHKSVERAAGSTVRAEHPESTTFHARAKRREVITTEPMRFAVIGQWYRLAQ